MSIFTKEHQHSDFKGEFDVEDFVVFGNEGSCLHDVGIMWEATKKYSKAIHKTITALVSATSSSGEMSNDVEAEILREENHRCFNLAEKHLLVASIVTTQCSFLEYALKRTYSEVIKTPPLPSKPKFKENLLTPLIKAGLIDEQCSSQLCHMQTRYDNIRNSFCHGAWSSLPDACESLDLFEFFVDVGRVLWSIEKRIELATNQTTEHD